MQIDLGRHIARLCRVEDRDAGVDTTTLSADAAFTAALALFEALRR
jgi:hypothetical protein